MFPSCNDQREELILAASEKRELTQTQRDHVASCAGCRALVDRIALSVRALSDLPSLEAPSELDGRVVASLQAGFREDRSVRHLSALEQVSAPHELEATLQRSKDLEADLFARVEQELLHPEMSVGKRLARHAERLTAPEQLEYLVAADLLRNRAPRPFPLRLVAGFVTAAAALAFVWTGLGSETDPSTKTYSFTIREVSSVQELTPMARSFVNGVGGGAPEVREF